MSGGKGVAHEVIDRIVKLEAALKAQQTSFIKEVTEKHNNIAAQVTAIEQIVQQVAGFTASEIGKTNGTIEGRFQAIAKCLYGVDINIFALGEMVKEILGQITQVDTVFKQLHTTVATLFGNSFGGVYPNGVPRQVFHDDIVAFNKALELGEAEVEKVKKDTIEWYHRLLNSAMASSRRHMEEQEAAEAALQAQQEAQRTATVDALQAHAEKQDIEAELKNAATAERSVVAPTSGGQGSEFPDGAEIFGG